MLVVISMSIVIPFIPEHLLQPFVDFAFLVVRNICDQILINSPLPDLPLQIMPFSKNLISALRKHSSSQFLCFKRAVHQLLSSLHCPFLKYSITLHFLSTKVTQFSSSLQAGTKHLLQSFLKIMNIVTRPQSFLFHTRPVNMCHHVRKTFWLLIKTQDFFHASKIFS